MSRQRPELWRLRLGRWLTIALPTRSLRVTLGSPGRRLTIGRRGVIVRVRRGGATVTWTWRGAWHHPRAAHKRRGG